MRSPAREIVARSPSSVTIGDKSYPISCFDVVECHIRLVRQSIDRKFTDVPIELLLPPGYAYVATPLRERATDVQVTGPQHEVDELKKENIVLYVDLRDPKLVPQETPYTQPIYAEIVDEHQRPVSVTGMAVKPAISTCAVKISPAKPD